MTTQVLPCMAMVHVPAGALDAAARARYVRLAHDAFRLALPDADNRMPIASVIVHDVADGSWGANGTVWRLPEFAQAAGSGHLQSLVRAGWRNNRKLPRTRLKKVVPMGRIELPTSPLPRECSTTEPHGH